MSFDAAHNADGVKARHKGIHEHNVRIFLLDPVAKLFAVPDAECRGDVIIL